MLCAQQRLAICFSLLNSLFLSALCAVCCNQLIFRCDLQVLVFYMSSRTATLLLIAINRLLVELLTVEEEAAQKRIARLEARLGPGRGHGGRSAQHPFPAEDVYSKCVNRRDDRGFLAYTRFTRAQFDILLAELRPLIEANRRVRLNVAEPTGRRHACKLSTENRLLLTLKFLVVGGSCESLGADFGIDGHVVSEDVRHVIYAILDGISYEIHFPEFGAEVESLPGTVSARYPRAIGLIDATYTPSQRQHGDFSGHRWMPLRSHQVVTNSLGMIMAVDAGLPGARHDSFEYSRSRVPALQQERDAELLGDDGYVGMQNIRTPPTAKQVPDDRAREELQTEHTNKRSRIEQFFSVLKQWFPVTARKWERHDRTFLACCFVACCLLYNRRKRLNA